MCNEGILNNFDEISVVCFYWEIVLNILVLFFILSFFGGDLMNILF